MRAVLFPGQGAQAVGMGEECCEAFPECRAVFDRANEVLGQDLATLCFEGPLEELTRSSNAQPGIFVASMACLEALRLQKPDISFAAVAGLSSGEWTALHVAGVIGFDDTLRVLQARGRFMQRACEKSPGGMLGVIGLDAEALAGVAREAGVEVANFNSPGQTVLSGPKDLIAAAETKAKEAGAKRAIPLNVAGAFHSRLMADAEADLRGFLADIPIQAPDRPVLSNVTGQPHESAEGVRDLMARQVTSSVQWVQDVQWMGKQGVTEYLECGPGKVLTGLVKRIDKQATLLNIHDRSSLDSTLQALE